MSHDQVEAAPMAKENAVRQREGSYGMIYLYLAFLTVPGIFMTLMTREPGLPENIAPLLGWFGVSFSAYGIYKIFQHMIRCHLVDPNDAPGSAYIVRFMDFVDGFRYRKG